MYIRVMIIFIHQANGRYTTTKRRDNKKNRDAPNKVLRAIGLLLVFPTFTLADIGDGR